MFTSFIYCANTFGWITCPVHTVVWFFSSLLRGHWVTLALSVHSLHWSFGLFENRNMTKLLLKIPNNFLLLLGYGNVCNMDTGLHPVKPFTQPDWSQLFILLPQWLPVSASLHVAFLKSGLLHVSALTYCLADSEKAPLWWVTLF